MDANYHEEFGKLSAIPPCCREWFIRVWYGQCMQLPYPRQWNRTWKADYVQCPGCRQCNAYNTLRLGSYDELRRQFYGSTISQGTTQQYEVQRA